MANSGIRTCYLLTIKPRSTPDMYYTSYQRFSRPEVFASLAVSGKGKNSNYWIEYFPFEKFFRRKTKTVFFRFSAFKHSFQICPTKFQFPLFTVKETSLGTNFFLAFDLIVMTNWIAADDLDSHKLWWLSITLVNVPNLDRDVTTGPCIKIFIERVLKMGSIIFNTDLVEVAEPKIRPDLLRNTGGIITPEHGRYQNYICWCWINLENKAH